MLTGAPSAMAESRAEREKRWMSVPGAPCADTELDPMSITFAPATSSVVVNLVIAELLRSVRSGPTESAFGLSLEYAWPSPYPARPVRLFPMQLSSTLDRERPCSP